MHYTLYLYYSHLYTQFSWAKFISQRCSNINRDNKGLNEIPQRSKRKKNKNLMKHQYLEDADSIIVKDSVAFNRNMERLAAELLKAHPVASILEDLMRKTYPNRCASILSGECSLMDTCEKFPLLKNAKHVCIMLIDWI